MFGYWIYFKANIVSGSALLVPAGSDVEYIRSYPLPQGISVETDVKAYEDFRLLEDDKPQAYRFEPLPVPGDYDLTGRVSQVLTVEDGQVWVVRVIVDAFAFEFGPEDLNGITVSEGAWVQFRARELALFDENY